MPDIMKRYRVTLTVTNEATQKTEQMLMHGFCEDFQALDYADKLLSILNLTGYQNTENTACVEVWYKNEVIYTALPKEDKENA